MPSSSSRKLADVSPTNRPSRIEKRATELTEIRQTIAALELRKKELAAQLLKLVKAEGAIADDGKLRYEGDAHRFVVIESKSTKLDTKKLMKYGVSARIIQKSTAETPYEYVRVDARTADEEGD